MSEGALRVLIADDDADTRTILEDYLTHYGHEVHTTGDAEQALAWAEAQPVDVALLDVVMPGPSGVDLLPRLKSLQPEMEVILFTAYGTIPQTVDALQSGAADYLEKPLQLNQVREAVERAWEARQAQARALKELTWRERDVLRLLAKGKTDGEIAQALGVSVLTTRAHVRNILAKLGAKNRVQAALVWDRCTRTRPS